MRTRPNSTARCTASFWLCQLRPRWRRQHTHHAERSERIRPFWAAVTLWAPCRPPRLLSDSRLLGDRGGWGGVPPCLTPSPATPTKPMLHQRKHTTPPLEPGGTSTQPLMRELHHILFFFLFYNHCSTASVVVLMFLLTWRCSNVCVSELENTVFQKYELCGKLHFRSISHGAWVNTDKLYVGPLWHERSVPSLAGPILAKHIVRGTTLFMGPSPNKTHAQPGLHCRCLHPCAILSKGIAQIIRILWKSVISFLFTFN